ncbi:hypothetical protein BKA65DRAFT_164399 [Rhexocercosporidium sp. MPI-PUGE-AT-0058]|nr:hypothetical protein BKA65DRAFT_164399 [Rhexocercosporidium sp. MPI-PUGE-AT-0058]
MDPLTTISLVANIVAFIDFGYKIVSVAREVHQSSTGTTSDNEDLEFLSTKLQGLAVDLKPGKPGSAMTADELRLAELVDECQEVSTKLLGLLNSLKVKNPKLKRQVIATVFRNMRKTSEKEKLEGRLDRCQQQLHLQLFQTSRLDALGRLEAIQKSGQCQQEVLLRLSNHVMALSDSFKATNLGPELLNDIRSLLNRSDAALSSVIQNRILDGLQFEKMNDRLEDIEKAHAATFGWLLDESARSEESLRKDRVSMSNNESYQDYGLQIARENDALRRNTRESFINWLSEGTGIFHISGKPGAGKSTLMKYLSMHSRTEEYLKVWSGDKQLALARFFFWRHGSDFQKSFKGLLRSLLHSILAQCPDFIKVAFPVQWEMARQGMALRFEHSDVQAAFDRLMRRSDVYSKHMFAFFIDGLDEFEGRENHLVRTLFDWLHSGPDAIKICVSSRELPIFQERFLACPKFRLHELTQSDILAFVEDVLRSNEDVAALAGTQDFTSLGRCIVSKAEGVFLWVSLALKAVEHGVLAEDRMEDLIKKIDFLPIELEDLFQAIFDSIKKTSHPIDFQRAMILFAIVPEAPSTELFYKEPSLLQLSFLDDFEGNSNFAATIHGPLSTDDIEKRLKRCQKRVDSSCRGFLSVISEPNHFRTRGLFRRDRVVLTHRSLVEFLQKPGVQAVIEKYTRDFDRFGFSCQSLVAEIESCGSELGKKRGNGIQTPYFEYEYRYDIAKLISEFLVFPNSSLSTLFSALDMLAECAKSGTGQDSSYRIALSQPCQWKEGEITSHHNRLITCHPSRIALLVAQSFGLYELWSPSDKTRPNGDGIEIYDMLDLILPSYLNYQSSFSVRAPADRILKSFVFCLRNGASPEALAYHPENEVNVRLHNEILPTYWHLLLWTSVHESIFSVPPESVYMLFLLYGANPNFWLKFDDSHDQEEYLGLVLVAGLYGLERRQVFSPIFVSNGTSVIEFARKRNWLVSLRDLVGFWFPASAEKIQGLIDLNANRNGSPTSEDLSQLEQEYGFGLQSWKPLGWNMPQPLFRSWKGTTKRLSINRTHRSDLSLPTWNQFLPMHARIDGNPMGWVEMHG